MKRPMATHEFSDIKMYIIMENCHFAPIPVTSGLHPWHLHIGDLCTRQCQPAPSIQQLTYDESGLSPLINRTSYDSIKEPPDILHIQQQLYQALNLCLVEYRVKLNCRIGHRHGVIGDISMSAWDHLSQCTVARGRPVQQIQFYHLYSIQAQIS